MRRVGKEGDVDRLFLNSKYVATKNAPNLLTNSSFFFFWLDVSTALLFT